MGWAMGLAKAKGAVRPRSGGYSTFPGDGPGPRGVREEGRLCHASAHRAVRALRALVDYAEFRRSLE